MKKLLYVLAFAIALGVTASSCTDENVQPTANGGAGGGAIDPK